MRPVKLIKVGLVQIGDKFQDRYYLPYSIGVLQAYAQKNLKEPEDFLFLSPIYKKIEVEKAAGLLSKSDIVFFSTYIWNYKISLEIARRIKRRKDSCIIVFGGPQVPESKVKLGAFLRQYPFIDIACCGEGEATFVNILENFREKAWENVPSSGFIGRDNNFIFNPEDERTKPGPGDMPSPYLEGVFEPLMRGRDKWSALIETNRGCPYSCAFCYWGKKTRNKVNLFDLKKVFNEIDWLSRNKIEFIFCCDANFGLLPRDTDIIKKVTRNKKRFGYPVSFSVQNTKNSSRKIFAQQKALNDAGLQKGVNLALQSLNPSTLKSIGRTNIANDTYRELQHLFAEDKIPTFSDIILGLPRESYDTFTSGVSGLIESGQHNRIQFINLAVLENTAMSEPAYQKKYDFVVKETKAIAHHTAVENGSTVCETQKLVIGNSTMPRADWARAKVFSLIMSLVYFDKLLQVPFIILNKTCAASYKSLAEFFIDNSKNQGIFSEIINLFIKNAKDIQKGNSEYIASRDWLNIWWPADEYAFIKLCRENKLTAFYKEAELAINRFLEENNLDLPEGLLRDCLALNKSLIKLPFMDSDTEVSLDYNIYEVYQGLLSGRDIALRRGGHRYLIDRTTEKWKSWDDWLREVVWYGTKRGAYLYGCRAL